LHLLVVTDDPTALAAVRDELSSRWQSVVARVLGAANVPDDEHGCDLRPCHSAGYIAKMGLEIADPSAAKKGRVASRTPFQIADDAAQHGRARDVSLWRDYCAAFHGAKQLNWSVGLKDQAKIEDPTDEEIVAGDGQDLPIVAIEDADWRLIRTSPQGPLRLLEAVEMALRAHQDPVLAALAELRRIHDWAAMAAREWGEVAA
jgi:hypothetical protein